MRIVIVAPVYNEEEGIVQFHEKTRIVLDAIPEIDTEILFVVDRCRDKTLEKLRQVVNRDPKCRVLALSSRFGHQNSLIAGIEHALDSDAIIMMDSDLQHPPEIIPELISKFKEGYDVVYTLRQDNEDVGFLREKAGLLFYKLIRWISSVDVKTNAADFRLISRRVAAVLTTSIPERRLFLRGLVAWVGYNQVGVNYNAAPRAAGISKYTVKQALRLAISGVLAFSTKPLYLGIYLGLSFAGLSFIYAIFLIAHYFSTNTLPSGWTTLSVLVLMATGTQLFVVGVIGLYIGGIYDEVKSRPRYIVDEEIKYGGA